VTLVFKQSFLSLVRLGIGHRSSFSEIEDWQSIYSLADEQGLMAIVVDGIEHLPEACRPSKVMFLEWVGTVMRDYEWRYDLYWRAIADLAAWHRVHGFKMMVLKGYACALTWPKPEHRPCGDIDIWQFGQQKEADAALAREEGVKVDASHHHHTVFRWRGFTVENHYDFINLYTHKSNRMLEGILKELAQDDSHYVEVGGEKVYLPSADLHALFLLRHAMAHFAAEEMTLRQLLDWAFFVKAHGDKVNWEWLMTVLRDLGSLDLFHVLNSICVEDLGFDSSIFPAVQSCPFLKDRVLNEILEPEIPNALPRGLFKRVIWKLKRWKANAWKRRLVYDESMWSSFWHGVWAHLLKPASI